MKISKIEIKNIGPFKDNTVIELDGKISTIIGENGTGKSTILFLIRFVLDPKIRKLGINENLIYDISKAFKIKIIFNTEDNKNNNAHINSLPIIENNKIMIEISSLKNDEINIQEPIIVIGEIEKIQYNIFQKLPFDDYIDLIYINSQYESNDEMWINKKFEDEYIKEHLSSQILSSINDANCEISQIKEIKDFKDEVNNEILNIFKNDKFNLSLASNIETKKIGKALKFFPIENSKTIDSHGDGFNKIFSIIAKIKTNSNEGKESILIIDELENHLFHSYQRQLIDYLDKLNINQSIVITHSPNLITLLPNSSITKVRLNAIPVTFFISPESDFYYWQVDLASSIFYEYVIIVEGHSEKIFYEFLLNKNESFKKKLGDKNLFIMCNSGIHFKEKVSLLKKLCKKVIVLTDNDFWLSEKEEMLMGIKRIYEIIRIYDETYKIDENVFKYSDRSKNTQTINDVIKRGEKKGIYTQSVIGHTFEDSLKLEKLIRNEDVSQLKKSKMKKLSSIIDNISKKIDDSIIDNSEYLFKWISKLNDED